MSDIKLTPEAIDWAVERVEKKEFMTLDTLGVTLCILRLKDGTAVVGTNAVSTDSSDLETRYQSAFERALKEAIDVSSARGPFDDHPNQTAG